MNTYKLYEYLKMVVVYGVLSTQHLFCVNSCCVSVLRKTWILLKLNLPSELLNGRCGYLKLAASYHILFSYNKPRLNPSCTFTQTQKLILSLIVNCSDN